MQYIILLFGPEEGPGYEELPPDAFETAMQHHTDFATWCGSNGISIDHSLALVKSENECVIETDSPELAKEAARRCPNYGANVLRPAASRG